MGFLKSLEKKFFRTGRSHAKAEAEKARQASARNAQNIYNLLWPNYKKEENILGKYYDPARKMSLSSLFDEMRNGVQAIQRPDLPEIQGMSDQYMTNRANIAGQLAGQQYANAGLNARRRMGSRNAIVGSGNLNGALQGADLAAAKARSLASSNMFTQLDSMNQNKMLDQSIDNQRMAYDFDVNEARRQMNRRNSLYDYFAQARSNMYTNPLIGYYNNDTKNAYIRANQAASQVHSPLALNIASMFI